MPSPAQARLHPVNRKHLAALSGDPGILQHSSDDFARSLEVDLLHARTLGWLPVAASANRNLERLEAAFDDTTGRFAAVRDVAGDWVVGPGTHDSHGRVLLALGETIAAAPDTELAQRAMALFAKALPFAGKVTSARGQAAVVLACAAMTRPASPGGAPVVRDPALDLETVATMRRLATALHARFLDYARPGGPWPEETLTHENALLPRALIVAAGRLKADAMGRIGLQVLDWLISVQTAPEGHFSLVGHGAWTHRGEKSKFDQRPIEATSLLQAADAAYAATGDPRYLEAMERAYAWFLGANDLGRKLASPARGAGSDGLTPTGPHANEGAESTLMWLMASEHIRALRSQPPRARVAAPRSQVLPSAIAGPATVS
jgi:hypothetical protein